MCKCLGAWYGISINLQSKRCANERKDLMQQWKWLSEGTGSGSGAECDFGEGIQRMMNNKKLYTRLLTSFVESDYMQKVRDSVAGGDPGEIRAAAHTMKGVAANLSLNTLRFHLEKLDHTVRDGVYDDLLSLLANIEESYERTLVEIAAYIEA